MNDNLHARHGLWLEPRRLRARRSTLGPRWRRFKGRCAPLALRLAHLGGWLAVAKLVAHGALHLLGVAHPEGW